MPGADIAATNNAASIVRTTQTDAGFIPEAKNTFPVSVRSGQLANFVLTFGAVTHQVEVEEGEPFEFGHNLFHNHRTKGDSTGCEILLLGGRGQ